MRCNFLSHHWKIWFSVLFTCHSDKTETLSEFFNKFDTKLLAFSESLRAWHKNWSSYYDTWLESHYFLYEIIWHLFQQKTWWRHDWTPSLCWALLVSCPPWLDAISLLSSPGILSTMVGLYHFVDLSWYSVHHGCCKLTVQFDFHYFFF